MIDENLKGVETKDPNDLTDLDNARNFAAKMKDGVSGYQVLSPSVNYKDASGEPALQGGATELTPVTNYTVDKSRFAVTIKETDDKIIIGLFEK